MKISLLSSLLVCCWLVLSPKLAAAVPEARPFTKSINKRFVVNQTGSITLDNRYGNINYTIAGDDVVRISVTIEVDARTEAKAEEIFERISIDFSGAPSLVSAKTVIDGSNNGWTWSTNSTSYKINYEVSAPKDFELILSNRYGNSSVADLAGAATFDIRYGDLRTGNIAGATELSLAYGKAHLDKLHDLTADVKYGEVRATAVADGKVVSRYSQLSLKRVETLTLDSQHDDYALGSVHKLTNSGRYDKFAIDSAWLISVATRYTDMRIGWLAEAAKLQMRYGDAYIASTAAGVEEIDLNGQYTNFVVNLDPAVKYQLTAEGKYAQISLPADMTVVRKESAGSTTSYAGHAGTNPQSRVALVASYGSIRIK